MSDRKIGAFLNARLWLRGMVRAVLRPRPKMRMWEWLQKHVVIPVESGSPNPGPLRLSRFPVFKGLYDLAQKPGVHFLTLCASARVGKTLFTICVVLYWIAERFGQVVWLDPTRKSAMRLVRGELDPFLLQCAPVKKLAIFSKTAWTALEKQFRGKAFRVVGSGAEADLHGFQAELAVINEADRCKASLDRDAASSDKIIARTRQFAHTRLILRNSTPTEELGDIWQNFLRGSQHHCYHPCPHCSAASAAAAGNAPPAEGAVTPITPPLHHSNPPPGWSPLSLEPHLAGWQRLTFFPEQKDVPFAPDGSPLPPGQLRTEQTGQIRFDQFAIYEERASTNDATQTERVKTGYDIEAVAIGATYQCAWCKRDIEWSDLNWMLSRYQWRAHNAKAPSDHVSAHISALYSPFEFWGILAKEFLEAKGSLARLIKFETLTLGRAFIRHRSAIQEDDIDRAVKRTPIRYVQGQIPAEPVVITMTVDVQGEQFWYVIRGWGILWDHPDWPTWSALLDWGEAVNWEQIEELAGLRKRADGAFRRFKFAGAEYRVTAGLVDSGHEAKENKNVYEFTGRHSEIFSPYKGGDQSKTRGDTIRPTPILKGTQDLVWAWSDFFAAALYYAALRDGRNSVGDLIHWWLPINLDSHYKSQLTAD